MAPKIKPSTWNGDDNNDDDKKNDNGDVNNSAAAVAAAAASGPRRTSTVRFAAEDDPEQERPSLSATTTSTATRHHHQHQQQHALDIDIDAAAVATAVPVGTHRLLRPSVVRRPSFIRHFASTKGPPQIAGLMMLIAIGLGCVIGVVPAVMTDRFARLEHGYTDSQDCSDYIDPTTKPLECLAGSADAQTAVSTSNLISNVLTFLTSSMMGSISDEYGRRGLLIFGLVLGTIPPFLLCSMQYLPQMSPWWYYSARAATGIVNWVAVALSALADVLPPRFRAPGIGLLLAGFMLGFSLAPILSMLLSRQHLTLVSLGTVVTGLVLSIFFLPETLPPNVAAEARRRRQEANQAEMDDAAAAAAAATDDHDGVYQELPGGGGGRSQRWRLLSLLHCNRRWTRCAVMTKRIVTRPLRELAILNRNTFFRLISLLAFFSGMVASGDQVLLIYYLEERLAFTNRDVSIMFFIMGIMGLLAQAVLLKPLNDFFGEKLVVALAFCCGAIDNTMYGLARNKQTIFAAVSVAGLTGMAFPTISAMKSNNVAESEQGRIQGALYSLQALASGLGPVVLRYVYGKTQHTSFGPGAMFLFAAGLYVVAVCIACALPKDKANSSSRRHGSEDDNQEGIVDEQYSQLLSDSSSDEDDYGTGGP